MNWHRDSFLLTTDAKPSSVLDTFELLQSTYWAHKRPLNVVEKMLSNSLCFYLLESDQQVGFARVITDYTTTSWLCDVVIDVEHQSAGLGSWMMQCVFEHPEIRETQYVLQTGTAHKFYQQLGFSRHESLMSTPVDYL